MAPAPTAAATEISPRCGDCICFQDPPQPPEGADPVAWAQAGKDRGQCFRYPQPVAKRANDFCFEFVSREGDPHAG